MLWDGNRQAQEYTDTHVFTTVYDQDSFEPVARLVWLKPSLLEASNDEQYSDKPNNPIQIYHYHNDHLGTPNELTNNQGEVVWLADYEAWGNTAKVVWHEVELQQIQIAKDELQPIRFQGQTIDQETGLHYNRFRYYDPDVGMFISRDPIGLMGGNNVFQYAPNPTGWIDPWGLSPSSKLDTALKVKRGDKLSAHHLIPVEVWKENQSFFDAIGMGGDRDKLSNGLLMPGSESAYKDGLGKGNRAYHSSNHNDYSDSVRRDIDQIKQQNLSKKQSRLAVKRLQMRLRREIWGGLRPMNRKNRLC